MSSVMSLASQRAMDSCEGIGALSLPNVRISLAKPVAAGAFTAPGAAAAMATLPAFCRVAATLTPSADSDIKIEVWMPASGWNGKFQAVGNGGWSGAIAYAAMGTALSTGYATASTDTGHSGSTASFAPGHPEKLTDFGYRSVHEMTVAAKAVIAAHYGNAPRLSYWRGCSAGGRQGLKEAQQFPADFDAIIAGAPALDWTGRASSSMRVGKALHQDEQSYIPRDKYGLIHSAVLDACDAIDGVKDGVLENPRRCTFDPKVLECRGSDTATCLTPPQVEAARQIYAGPPNGKTGRSISGLERGSELGWATWGGPQPFGIGLDHFRFVVFGSPTWDFRTFDFAADAARAEELDGGTINALDPDLRAFFARGGKLLQYHGWGDPQIAPGSSVQYFERVSDLLGAGTRVAASYRLFMVPGMAHCGGGDGTSTFDVVGALERWAEKNEPPDRIEASRVRNGKVDRTRPLCPYPQVARYRGTGSTDDAASFVCAADGSPAAPRPPEPAARPVSSTMTLSIVGTNDLHGAIVPSGGNGGLALFAGYLKNLRATRERDGGAVLLVDGGDMFQGTLESNLGEGTSVVAAYNALGYAAAAVGNHEFDFGPVGPNVTPRTPADDPRGALKARAAEAKFPFLAANLIDTATGRPVEWPNVRPSTIVSAGGITVGIVGVITAEALSATLATNTRGLSVAPLAPAIAGEASRLRSEGAAIVIVAAHAGGRCKAFDNPSDLSPCEARAEIVNVARELPRGLVDVIVAGHSHAGMAHQVEDVAVIESFASGRAFGRVDLSIDRTTNRVTSKRIHPPRPLCQREDPATHDCTGTAPGAALVPSQYEGAPVVPDAAIARVLAPAIEQVRELKARLVGPVLETPIRRQNGNESPLGNLVTDALRMGVPGTDIALHNIAGGLRADLPRGPLTFGSVFEVMPFDNRVVQLRLTGAQVRSIFATQLQRGRILGVSGVRVIAECSGTALHVTMRRPSGPPIADADQLMVSTIDFLATAGDGLLAPVVPLAGFTVPDAAPLSRDVVVEQLSKRGGTLREEALINPENPRWTFPGPLPVACRGH